MIYKTPDICKNKIWKNPWSWASRGRTSMKIPFCQVHVNLECLISCILRKVIEIEIRSARMELAVKNNWLNFLKIIEGALTEKRSTEMMHCAARSSAINSIEDFCQSKAFLAIFSKNAWGKTPQLMIVRLAHWRDALWFQMGKIRQK